MIGQRRALSAAAPAAYSGPPPAASLEFVFKQNGGSGTDASSYAPLAAAVPLGAAAADRIVVATIHWRSTSGTPTAGVCSIGGVTLTQRQSQVEATSNRTGVAVYTGIVDGGLTTGDLHIAFSSTVVRCMYTLGVIYGADPVPFDIIGIQDSPSGAETNPSVGGVIDVPEGGVALGAITANYSGSFTSFTWSGLADEHVDTQATETNPYGLATADEMSAETDRAVSVTITGVNVINRPLILASFGLA